MLIEVYCNQVKRCIEIALDFLKSNRQERPTLQHIVSSSSNTETLISNRRMQNKQFNQDDGKSDFPFEVGLITMNSRPSLGDGDANMHTHKEPRAMSLQLLRDMTNNFSEERLIGRGGFGDVYRGIGRDGQTIAVKKLHSLPGIGDKQFKEEFAILVKAHHQNIVRILGYCYEKKQDILPYEGKLVFSPVTHMAMCYEYLPNGSLDRYLSDIGSGPNWQTRYGIIRGICEGLDYLHQGLEGPIFHMNLKPSSILLDENMMPKIGDFGLQRLLGAGIAMKTMDRIGAIGYMPPEYIEKQVISNKFDIFSLGVLIVELVTGTRLGFLDVPLEEFIELAHEKWRERLQKTVHILKLIEGYLQQVKKCLELALKCVQPDRRERPTICDIITTLDETETLIE